MRGAAAVTSVRGDSVSGDSRIPEGIDKIAKVVPDARVVEPASEDEENES